MEATSNGVITAISASAMGVDQLIYCTRQARDHPMDKAKVGRKQEMKQEKRKLGR